MRALDISKYTGKVDDGVVTAWCNEGIGLVIIQAHPANYGQESSLADIRTVTAHRCANHPNGMPWDAYIYDYLSDDGWMNGALATLDMAAAEGHLPRNGWLDEEDNRDVVKGWDVQTRAGYVRSHLSMFDAWLVAHGRPMSGIYTGQWWWGGLLDNWVEWKDRELWDANYDNNPDAAVFTPYGGWTSCRIKQYMGTSTDVVTEVDLDVLSDDETAELGAMDNNDLPQEARDMGCSDWRCYAINLKGIADAMGQQVTDATVAKKKAEQDADTARQAATVDHANLQRQVDDITKQRDDATAQVKDLQTQLAAAQAQAAADSAAQGKISSFLAAAKDLGLSVG